jgi:hypothetical protein
MSKKWKVILIVIAAVVVLGVSGGAVVMAQDQDQPPSASNPLLARVAEILGRTETQLTDAIKAARIEVAKEQITAALEKAVSSGTITPADEESILKWLDQQPDPADKAAIKSWWQSRPEISKPKLYGLLLGARSRILRLGWCRAFPGVGRTLVADKVAAKLGVTSDELINAIKQASQELKASTLQKALSNAVSNGKLTQGEADQISSWWAQRPAALDKIAPGFGFGRGFCFPRIFRSK